MSMADNAEVCGCNGVCKGTIVKAIQEHGLFSVDEVKKHQGRQLCGRTLRQVSGTDPDQHRGRCRRCQTRRKSHLPSCRRPQP